MNDDKCFRCGAQPKIVINMTIDDKIVKHAEMLKEVNE